MGSIRTCWCFCFVSAILMLPTLAFAQQQNDQSVEEAKVEGRPRLGGYARDEVVLPDGNESEGMEEGMPRLRGKATERAIKPDFFPPRQRFRWRLGVFAYNTDTGIVVTRVVRPSAASRLGLEPGDRIVNVNGFQIGWVRHQLFPLASELQLQAGPRGRVTLLVQNVRNNRLLTQDVQLDRWR